MQCRMVHDFACDMIVDIINMHLRIKIMNFDRCSSSSFVHDLADHLVRMIDEYGLNEFSDKIRNLRLFVDEINNNKKLN